MGNRNIARRDALRRLALGGLGVAAVPGWVEELTAQALAHAHPRAPQAASQNARRLKVFTRHQDATVAAIAEAIIPETETPGAKTAGVNEFIDTVLADAEPGTRNRFFNGLSWVDERSRRLFGADFIALTPDQQVALLTPLSTPAQPDTPAAGKDSTYVATQPLQQDRKDAPPDQVGRDFFRAIKSMTITGYYTSEAGMREELGDDGTVFFEDYLGCDDPAYKSAKQTG